MKGLKELSPETAALTRQYFKNSAEADLDSSCPLYLMSIKEHDSDITAQVAAVAHG